jgi:1-deoxy-D-xylulose-5-phosphate synthase
MVIRYPRGEGVMPEWRTPFEAIKIGTGRKLKDGNELAILTIGHPGNFADKAIKQLRLEGHNPGHFDMRFVKPIDEAMLHEVCQRYPYLVTVEDGSVQGGFGSAVLEFMAKEGYKNQVRILGIPDRIVEHGTPKELHRECEYDTEAIMQVVREMLTSQLASDPQVIRSETR